MDTQIENIWIANAVTATVIIGIMGYFFKRYVTQNDKRLEDVASKSERIERNYIRRFEDVHRTMDETKNEIKDHFTDEIKEVVHDKNNYRQKQAVLTTQISSDVAHLIKSFDEFKHRFLK